ncbi:dolichyl-P-Man:Man(5)GlcNAc(2)-PP-dolichol alpha-1,3-mannosyltransferase [Neophaeococcomyces mojaviensis]|uniref:Dolichyl-P-Man:Man(5)GlcNAc(2)-PP-dolichol alpha-1,3-mannosyltransferase n=1 Tax=Neophaeococcomyces mojaviensis TaxID=3383035 RepID=A0ACC3A7L2_9EURO|nr:dolichyl-P-Man:Man(5)GlcNAc(2)-PP-dolichol alpha-1,3-mannosyltransferase [Knufia sp. JES_112]
MYVGPLSKTGDLVGLIADVTRHADTEIDWETYMIQVSKFLPPNYERDYSRLDGPTGPCVYPAIHLYIHSILYYITDHGKDIRLAQTVYAGLYLSTLALVLASYRRANAPPWLLVPLILSKRLHSIFLLRLFNDCWATFFFWLAVYAATRKWFSVTTLAWSVALGIKMTMLLPLPALGVILLQGAGIERTVIYGIMSCVMQIGAATPFMGRKEMPIYLKQAFDFGRQFLYKWTVNWRFVPEDTFLSRSFAYSLLAIHATLLLAFLHYKWVQPSSNGLWSLIKKHFNYMNMSPEERGEHSNRMTPQFVMDALLGSIVIGMVCARSIHYQFYAYLGWATPYLLWRSGSHPVIVLGVWALQEVAWLIYPSTMWSSATVVSLMALQVGCAWAAPSVNAAADPAKSLKKQH